MAEQAAVRQAIFDHQPGDLGLRGQLWTRPLVGELTAKLYRVCLTEPGWASIRPAGPVVPAPRRTRRRAGRGSGCAAGRSRPGRPSEEAEGLFTDQVGIGSDHVTGRTWGEKGRTPVVRRTGNRFPVNAVSATSTKGRIMVSTESFTARIMCRFLDRLVGHFDRKVHLVVDGHPAHRSRAVRAWLADHTDRIELHFLPAYTPERNPDELVDADLNRSPPMHSQARGQAQLAAETRRSFHRRQRQPPVVRGYYHGPSVRYALE